MIEWGADAIRRREKREAHGHMREAKEKERVVARRARARAIIMR